MPESPASKEAKHLVTAEHAQFETTCFYVAPIGEAASPLRKHSDLFLGSIIEPAVEPVKLRVIRADAIDKPGVITKQVIEYLLRARLGHDIYSLVPKIASYQSEISTQIRRATEDPASGDNQFRLITLHLELLFIEASLLLRRC